jgi:uncharacterized protein YggE
MNVRVSLKAIGAGALLVAAMGMGMVGVGRSAFAQDATPVTSAAPFTATVSVSGDGSVFVTPDAATVSIGVNTVNAELATAQAEANKTIDDILTALKAAGIDDKDIQTSNFSVSLLQDYNNDGTPGKITGYQVNNQLNVTVRKLDNLGTVLETVIAKGANSVYGINFIVTDPSAAASQARTQAVADATKKAQELAAAAGAKLGRVISISESSSQPPMPIAYAAGAAADSAKSVPIANGSNEIDINVQMVFELIQ